MRDLSAYFDIADVDTPPRLNPRISSDEIAGVPSSGTGLRGAAYAPGDSIWSIGQLNEVIAANTPDATFVASKVAYGSRESDTTIAEFLAEDASSIVGNGDLEMGPSGLTLSGFIYIPPGPHEISVASDDGFALRLGGVDFSEFLGGRAPAETARVAEFDGGLYKIDLSYFDGGGGMSLALLIDGLPVDDSALYQSVSDFENPPADVPLVPVDEYHPSHFLGEHILDGDDVITGAETRDVIEGLGGDDTIDGAGGDDEIYGGYGDDSIEGGDGDDVIDGGRGSDLISGGAGDDLLISRSDAGEQRIGQLALGDPTRPDPDNEVNQARQKLKGWEYQPLVSDDILIGGQGRDTFLISPQINAKLEIIEKHVKSDGTINWAGVAGENDELHDHWVDSFGIKIIADYVAGEDQIAVIGHTANVNFEYRDTDGDGDNESIITVISNQHGGGGAHDVDLIGQIIVHGDRVEEDDVITDNNVTYGVVETIYEVAEAIFPVGDTKVSDVAGERVFGYDTRDEDGNLGAVTGAPEDFFDNPYFDNIETANPSRGREIEETRYPFDQLPEVEAPGRVAQGGSADDLITQRDASVPAGLPGALAYYSLADGIEGAYNDARGGPTGKAFTLYENQSLLRTDGAVTGPQGEADGALSFNGEDEFAYIQHDSSLAITQGTIAIWVKPEDLSDHSVFLSKDQKNSGDGGHFKLGHTDDGGLILRFAPGDGDHNRTWETKSPVLSEGDWAHVAVNFDAEGVKVFVDGVRIAGNGWRPVEGDDPTPATYREAYILQNEEPWLLGASQTQTQDNDTAQVFGLDRQKLDDAFEGALAGFGVWGGNEAGDVLTRAEINQLIANGPGAALTNPSGPEPLIVANDALAGGGGADTIRGEGGDDTLNGDGGRDDIHGGYGDDVILGGAGADTLDGGRGSDLLFGGAGDDVLISRADIGEDRAGQLVLGEPSRDFPDPSIDRNLLKLVDWVDQPLAADDILIGGEGKDHFLFETLINGKKDIILDNLMEDGRGIHWHGVAGENRRIHDHWVDGIGIEIVADYVAGEDQISVFGHTTNVTVSYQALDANGDGVDDSIASIITAYSQQGNNGGAHDEDILGYIVVHGDVVKEEDVEIDPSVHYGIVDTIDQLQEALAPNGETKTSTGPNGETLFGYDTRDVAGDPIGSDPESYSSNAHAAALDFTSQIVDVDLFNITLMDRGGVFNGARGKTISHATGQSPASGTVALTFNADIIEGNQALFSKDASGNGDGGHLTIWLDHSGRVNVRLQSRTESFYLKSDEKIEAGEDASVAFAFQEDTLSLYVNGALEDEAQGFRSGMRGNTEDAVLGASTRSRRDSEDNLEWFFDGSIGNVVTLDRALTTPEAALLAGVDGDVDVLTANIGVADAAADAAILDETQFAHPEDGVGIGADGRDLVVIRGTDDAEVIRGSNDAEMIVGVGGSDTLMGEGGGDVLEGGDGDDMIIGGAGGDVLAGGVDNDTLQGGAGADSMLGGADEDIITGGGGRDTLEGGGGKDKLRGDGGKDALYGDDGADILRGGGGGDTLEGGDGRDKLVGNGGKDALFGGDGADKLRGGGANDTLDGGIGKDVLFGGAGRDLFVFGDAQGQDLVRDFRNGQDKLMFEGASSFADLSFKSQGAHTIVSFGSIDALIRQTSRSELDQSDFVF